MSEKDPNADYEMDRHLGSGMVLGLVAGAGFIIFETIVAGIAGPGFFGPLQMIGAILLGQGALQESLATPAAHSRCRAGRSTFCSRQSTAGPSPPSFGLFVRSGKIAGCSWELRRYLGSCSG